MIAQKGYILFLVHCWSVLYTDMYSSSDIEKNKSDYLPEDSREDAVRNVAIGKETLQSTLSMYSSSLVVDGNTDQNLSIGSCINIEKKGDSWWQVDLGDVYTIFDVRVYLADIVTDKTDCYEASAPWTYRGKASTTESGIPCQSWNIVHLNPYIDFFYTLVIAKEKNYCRGMFYSFNICTHKLTDYGQKVLVCENRYEKPWCYTIDPDVIWEYCNIDKCEGGVRDLIIKIGVKESNLEIPDHIENSDLYQNIRNFVLNNNLRARYVRFLQDGTRDYYPLCEVEVYGVLDDAVNVALGKPVEMSSYNGHFGPELAVDGDRNQYKSRFETAEEVNPWWRVDLSGIYTIFLIRLFNRRDCCSNKAHDIQLQLGTSLDTISNTSFLEGQIDDIQTIKLHQRTRARFVQLVRTGEEKENFHLYEVEVLGKLAACYHDLCENGGQCSVMHQHCGEFQCSDYLCACPDGYGSVHCELRTTNVAMGKRSELSSKQYKNWHPSNALDGDSNQNVLDGATCVSTQKEVNPYFTLELGDEYNITDVEVYLREDCCYDNSVDIDLFALVNSWTKVGFAHTVFKTRITFLVYPHVTTKYIKLMAKEAVPVFLQICEVEVYAIDEQEESSPNTTVASPTLVTKPQKQLYFIQMRFSLSDKYSEVVLSESSFLKSIREGLSSQTRFSVNSFTNLQVEKDPFRVSLQLHADYEDNVTLHEKFEKIDTLIRFGLLEIENEKGRLLAINVGSLQHRVMFNGGKKGTTAPASVFCVIMQMTIVFAVGIA